MKGALSHGSYCICLEFVGCALNWKEVPIQPLVIYMLKVMVPPLFAVPQLWHIFKLRLNLMLIFNECSNYLNIFLVVIVLITAP